MESFDATAVSESERLLLGGGVLGRGGTPTLGESERLYSESYAARKRRGKGSSSTRSSRVDDEEEEVNEDQPRLISRTKYHKVNINRHGLGKFGLKLLLHDPFHNLLDLTWWKLGLVVSGIFLLMHLNWALLYFCVIYWSHDRTKIITGMADQTTPAGTLFLRCLFFSVQTGQSIGYGFWAPTTVATNIFVSIEAYSFVLFQAFLCGIIYAKIARPSRMSRGIIFSNKAVINRSTLHYVGKVDGSGKYSVPDPANHPCLCLRLMNSRKTQLCDPMFRLYVLRKEFFDGTPYSRAASFMAATTATSSAAAGGGGEDSSSQAPTLQHRPVCWRLHDLNYDIALQRGRIRGTCLSAPHTLMPLTIVHTMDEASPLFKATPDSLRESGTEIIALMEGVDEGCSNNLQARWSYLPNEIEWDSEFTECLSFNNKTNSFNVDFSKFNLTLPCLPLADSTTEHIVAQVPPSLLQLF